MYIKVYTFGIEMSQRIHFWKQILLKLLFVFEKMTKNHFFGQKCLWLAKKNNFELKILTLLENHVKTQL